MPVFDIDVKIAGTLYIKAEKKEQAEEILKGLFVEQYYLDVLPDVGSPKNDPNNVYISGLDLDDADLPVVSLSPAMTVYGPWEGQKLQEATE